MLILHTTLFAPQTDDLDVGDLTAAWAILRQLETPQMIIYNCGVEAGSSQGHKHIQIFPRQDSEDFQMFPSKAAAGEGKSSPFEQMRALEPETALKYLQLTSKTRHRNQHPRSTIHAFRRPPTKQHLLRPSLHTVFEASQTDKNRPQSCKRRHRLQPDTGIRMDCFDTAQEERMGPFHRECSEYGGLDVA